jgi:hypothetical protein
MGALLANSGSKWSIFEDLQHRRTVGQGGGGARWTDFGVSCVSDCQLMQYF